MGTVGGTLGGGHKAPMGFRLFLFLLGGVSLAFAQDSQPLEAPTSPFDFDNYRRTPLQARQPSPDWASRDNQELQRQLISGQRGREQDIAARANALFTDPETIPLHIEPAAVPSPNELTDEIALQNYGTTTKGPRDLLARGKVADDLDLFSMSESDYQLLVAQRREATAEDAPAEDEARLRPMPTLVNSKTGGPPHGNAVSVPGVGARQGPRSDENPFEDLLRSLHLDQPVTRGSDPLPDAPTRLVAAPAAPASPGMESAPSPAEAVPDPTTPQP